jgi:hypothetical protein
MLRTSSYPPISDEVPWSERVTPYDEAHFIVYLRLLDASADGATEEEMSSVVLGIDPKKEPERARKALQSHLGRACWMTETGYRDLLAG